MRISLLDVILVMLYLIVAAFIFIGVVLVTVEDEKGLKLEKIHLTADSSLYTKQIIKDYIIKVNIKEPEIVYKQMLYETGHLNRNSLCCKCNNLFGFSFDGINLLKFDNVFESIYYYKFWQRYKTNYESEDYYEHLRKRWGAPDMENYIKTLKQIK